MKVIKCKFFKCVKSVNEFRNIDCSQVEIPIQNYSSLYGLLARLHGRHDALSRTT